MPAQAGIQPRCYGDEQRQTSNPAKVRKTQWGSFAHLIKSPTISHHLSIARLHMFALRIRRALNKGLNEHAVAAILQRIRVELHWNQHHDVFAAIHSPGATLARADSPALCRRSA